MNQIVFYVVAIDPIEIQASQAPQNVPLIPSFVKDINAVGRKMARSGRKMANSQGCLFFGAGKKNDDEKTLLLQKNLALVNVYFLFFQSQ